MVQYSTAYYNYQEPIFAAYINLQKSIFQKLSLNLNGCIHLKASTWTFQNTSIYSQLVLLEWSDNYLITFL